MQHARNKVVKQKPLPATMWNNSTATKAQEVTDESSPDLPEVHSEARQTSKVKKLPRPLIKHRHYTTIKR